jgi:hypothetical protein
MSKLTGVHSEVAAYEFTTLTCIPGTIHHKDTKIQLLDLPGIIEGASMGRGRGRQVIAVAKSSDCILMVCHPFTSRFFFPNVKLPLPLWFRFWTPPKTKSSALCLRKSWRHAVLESTPSRPISPSGEPLAAA